MVVGSNGIATLIRHRRFTDMAKVVFVHDSAVRHCSASRVRSLYGGLGQ
jgi:hypothetical protein